MKITDQINERKSSWASRLPMYAVILLLTIWFTWSICFSSRAEVSVSDGSLPEESAVCELDEREFTVRGANSGVLRVHRIFRIYSEAGKGYGSVLTTLNKFIKVDKLKAELRDFDGAVIKKLQKEDIHESALVPGYVLYTDDKAKYFNLSATRFPYSLEYSYEIKYQSLFYWPGWFPQLDVPVERSVYTLTVPKDFGFQMYRHNLEIEPVEKAENGRRQLVFELTQVPAFEAEDQMPPKRDHMMAVFFQPAEFDLDGYKGRTDSWEHFGEWYASLARKQYKLSKESLRLTEETVAQCSSAEDTVKTIYQYLQRKTRYVAIELAVGSYKPREAESVLATGYGDCKDLSTLFIAMLRAVGMKAFPVLIRTGDEGKVLADFPSNQFNHVVACVPIKNDTLWLDCTCAYCPFGELPSQDEGCQSLVVVEDTAALITTPTSSADENRLSRSLHATLALDGSITVEGTVSATGNFESYYRGLLNSYDATEKKEWLSRLVGNYAPNHTLLSSDFECIPDLDMPFSVGFTVKLNSYAIRSGDELLLNLNLLSRVDADEIPGEEERKYPVRYRYLYTAEDELTLDLPDRLVTKVVPQDQDIGSPFGSFETRYQVDDNRLIYKRTKAITRRVILPATYDDYKGFLNAMLASDRSFVVLVETE